MKFAIVLFAALFAVAFAAPAGNQQEVQTLRQDSDVQPESYKFGVETSDGSSHDSQGVLNNVGTDHESLAVKGSYKFVGEDGVTYQVNYIADENGFQPQGAHLPVA